MIYNTSEYDYHSNLNQQSDIQEKIEETQQQSINHNQRMFRTEETTYSATL